MENTEIRINNEDQVPEESQEVINQVTDNVSKDIEGQTTTENSIPEENVEKNDDEVVPSTTPKPADEQENVTEVNPIVSAGVSPGRTNVPFKEVNESEDEETSGIVNGTENVNNKKRELENEDDQVQEKILDNEERTGDQTKKMKITESNDPPIIDNKESGKNGIINGIPTVEV